MDEKSLKLKESSFDITIVLYALVIVLGLLFRLGSLIQDRTLWYDEAMLASSIFQHGFGELLKPLDYSQSAPVGFLFIVKVLTNILGGSQFVLRLYPLITGVFGICLFYLLLKEIGFKRPFIGAAFFATVHPLVYYSTELKPYMQDAFFIVASLYLYQLYSKKKITLWVYMLYCVLAVWISFSVIFVIGAITCYNFFSGVVRWVFSLVKRDFLMEEEIKRQLLGSVVFGASAVISFLICYFVYTKGVSSNIDEMSMEYWRHLKFPLMPEDASDWELMSLMVNRFLEFVFPGFFTSVAGGILWLGGSLLLIKRKFDFFWYSFLTVLFTLIASSIGSYPIEGRLLVFIIPVILIAIMCFVEVLADLVCFKAIEVIIFIGIIALNIGVLGFSNVNNVLRERQEATYLISYLNNNIEEDEKIYVFPNAVPIYEYMTGYEHGYNHFPQRVTESGQLIFGMKYWELECEPYVYKTTINEERLNENVEAIIKNEKVYILFYHQGGDAEYSLISTLREYGSVRLVMDEKNTPLYLFKKYIQL